MWGSSFNDDIVLSSRNGEGAGRRRETRGDLGLTSDEIPGQGNIDVPGPTVTPPSSRGPYDEVVQPYHTGWWITIRGSPWSLPDAYQRALHLAISEGLVKQHDCSYQQHDVQPAGPCQMEQRSPGAGQHLPHPFEHMSSRIDPCNGLQPRG